MVITIVGYPKDVEEVYFGEDGILENADKGTYLIDMTTTSPKLDQQIYEEAKKRGLHGLDAPVTGGDSGAKAGTLTILVGGDKEDFDTCLLYLRQWERLSTTKESPETDSTPRCVIRSPLQVL